MEWLISFSNANYRTFGTSSGIIVIPAVHYITFGGSGIRCAADELLTFCKSGLWLVMLPSISESISSYTRLPLRSAVNPRIVFLYTQDISLLSLSQALLRTRYSTPYGLVRNAPAATYILRRFT